MALKFDWTIGIVFGLFHFVFDFFLAGGIFGLRLGWFVGLTWGLVFGGSVFLIMGFISGTLRPERLQQAQ